MYDRWAFCPSMYHVCLFHANVRRSDGCWDGDDEIRLFGPELWVLVPGTQILQPFYSGVI